MSWYEVIEVWHLVFSNSDTCVTIKIYYLFCNRHLITNCRYVRVVKETDLKSVGLRPRRFEPCCRRNFFLFLKSQHELFSMCYMIIPSMKIQRHKYCQKMSQILLFFIQLPSQFYFKCDYLYLMKMNY